jgi:spore maturation protein CgeB
MDRNLTVSFFGSSLVSAYWNGAATYYRGICKALYERGHTISFYEPDAYDRQKHRDLQECTFAQTIVYPASESGVMEALEAARKADILIKASGVGVFDALLESAVLELKLPHNAVFFWDVDAPATLERVIACAHDPFRPLIPRYDGIVTYGGGNPVVEAYRTLQARHCVPIYNALDPATHFPIGPDGRFKAQLSFLGNRMPDREKRVEEFFFKPARLLPQYQFVLGGNGWEHNAPDLPNIRYLGHVYTRDHNSFNCSPRAILNVDRESMARYGFSPPTRIFEAAGAGACIITDAWEGIEFFLSPGKECLVAHSGEEVADMISRLTDKQARQIGDAARERILAEHTYAHRAGEVERIFLQALSGSEQP